MGRHYQQVNVKIKKNCKMRYFILSMCEQLLCDALSTAFSSEPFNISGYQAERIEKIAVDAGIAGCIAHSMSDFPVIETPKSWHDIHQRTKIYVTVILDELDFIADLVAKEGIPLVALKNGGIARGIYPCNGCCPMGDVDVLVEKHFFRKVHQILITEGYNFEFRNPLEKAELDAADSSGGAEYWKILPGGEKLWFELQWRPIAGRWIRPDQEPSTEKMMARSIPIPGTKVRLLSPVDNLLQVSLHTAKHTYVRAPGFRLHLDVERIVRAYPNLDWNLFLKRVKKLQVKTAVYFSLLIPYELFNTPIPDFVLDALRPTAWKKNLILHWLNRVGLFNPNERKFGKIGYIVFNALLYDDFKGLVRSILPARTWMKEKYGFSNNLLLPWYHFRRLTDLALRRVNT